MMITVEACPLLGHDGTAKWAARGLRFVVVLSLLVAAGAVLGRLDLKLDLGRFQPFLGNAAVEPLRALDVVAERAEAARDDLAFHTPPLDEDVGVEVVLGTLQRFEHRALPSCQCATTSETRVGVGELARQYPFFVIHVTPKSNLTNQF